MTLQQQKLFDTAAAALTALNGALQKLKEAQKAYDAAASASEAAKTALLNTMVG